MRNRFLQGQGWLGSAATTSNLWPARAVSGTVAEHSSKQTSSGGQEAARAVGPNNMATQQMPTLRMQEEVDGTWHSVTDPAFKDVLRNPNGSLIVKYGNSPPSSLSGYVQSCKLNFTTC